MSYRSKREELSDLERRALITNIINYYSLIIIISKYNKELVFLSYNNNNNRNDL